MKVLFLIFSFLLSSTFLQAWADRRHRDLTCRTGKWVLDPYGERLCNQDADDCYRDANRIRSRRRAQQLRDLCSEQHYNCLGDLEYVCRTRA